MPIYLHFQFMILNDKMNNLILKNTKDAVRASICRHCQRLHAQEMMIRMS